MSTIERIELGQGFYIAPTNSPEKFFLEHQQGDKYPSYHGVFDKGQIESLKAFAAALQPQGWQPIETIPGPLPDKQVSENFLIYLPGDDDLGYLPLVQEAFATVHGIEPVGGCSHMEDGIEPTHWQPLPVPPPAPVEGL